MPTILSFGRMSHLIIPLYGSEKFAIYIQESQVSGPNIDNKASEYVGAFQINFSLFDKTREFVWSEYQPYLKKYPNQDHKSNLKHTVLLNGNKLAEYQMPYL